MEALSDQSATVVRAARLANPVLGGVAERLAKNHAAKQNAAQVTEETTLAVRTFNTAERVQSMSAEGNYFRWTLTVALDGADSADASKLVHGVTFRLHPTFSPAEVTVLSTDANNDPATDVQVDAGACTFALTRSGWGTFEVGVVVRDVCGGVHTLAHQLSFEDGGDGSEQAHTILIAPASSSAADDSNNVGAADDDADAAALDAAVPSVGVMTEVPEEEMHGRLGRGLNWAAPLMITRCDQEARPGYASMQAHEYRDAEATLRAKIRVMADLLRRSQHCVAYTGAGISTSSGIDDYASKAGNSVATGTRAAGRPAQKRGLDAEPTFAHFTMAALHRAGHLKHWVQQNHDGLPQKARYPQEALNEIHGAWFDPSNPVVPMEGSLRTDLFNWMLKEEQEADLCLTMGSSLCGMNADRMVKTCGKKFVRHGEGLGSIIIGFQRTQLDDLASLRIFAPIDEVMVRLALEMQLAVDPTPYSLDEVPSEAKVKSNRHVFNVPYDRNGRPTKDGSRRRWDLSVGAKIKLTMGPGKGFVGKISYTPDTGRRDCAYTCRFPCTREGSPQFGKVDNPQHYALGVWFIESACNGTLPRLPVINY